MKSSTMTESPWEKASFSAFSYSLGWLGWTRETPMPKFVLAGLTIVGFSSLYARAVSRS